MLPYNRCVSKSKGLERQKDLHLRRRKAARLFDRGFSQAEVARRFDVSRVSAMRWHHAWEREGAEGLEPTGPPGRPVKLSIEDRELVNAALLEGPSAHGFETELWTLARAAKVIERVAGVRYHPGHVWRVLRDMGWSLQRPTTRARERDEDAILTWKKRRFARLKKTPDDRRR